MDAKRDAPGESPEADDDRSTSASTDGDGAQRDVREEWQSSGFWSVNQENPCPHCGGMDRCSVTYDGAMCNCRTPEANEEEPRLDRDGQPYWPHPLDGETSARMAGRASGPPRASADELDRVYCAFLRRLDLSKEHRQDLIRRGFPDYDKKKNRCPEGDSLFDVFGGWGYRTMPGTERLQIAKALVEEFGQDLIRKVPGFYWHEKKQRWSITGQAGMLVPLRDTDGRIVALHRRADEPSKDGSRYFYLTSNGYGGPGVDPPVHVPMRYPPDTSVIRITEGALKADIASMLSDVPTISVQGVGMWGRAVAVLRRMGAGRCRAKIVRIAFDADARRKLKVAIPLKNLVVAIREAGYTVDLETWPELQPDSTLTKGIDDLLAAGLSPKVIRGEEAVDAAVSAILAEARNSDQASDGSGPKAQGSAPTAEDNHQDEAQGEEAKLPTGAKLAVEYAALMGDTVVFMGGHSWGEWDRTHWVFTDDDRMRAACDNWLKSDRTPPIKLPSNRLIGEMLSALKRVLCPNARPLPYAQFDTAGLIPLQNGMLNPESRELAAFLPTHYNTYTLDFEYDPSATAPMWGQFMNESMRLEDGGVCREWIDLLQEFFGYCLVPSAKAEAILINVGEGGNGKGVFTKVLTALVGRRQVAALDLKQLGGPHSDYVHASLFGKLVALINEPNRKHMLDCGEKLYAISSGDLISARRPTEKVFEYNPYCRLVMSCNQIPATADLTDAIQRRVFPVEWRNKPAAPDTLLVEKLVGELPGILNWALDGLDRLCARGWKFAIPEESKRLRDDYLKSQDSAAQFLDSSDCETDQKSTDLWCVPADLHKVYTSWCKTAGYQALNICDFGKHLTKRLGYPPVRSRKIGDRVVSVRYGIRIVSSPYREEAVLEDLLRDFNPKDHR